MNIEEIDKWLDNEYGCSYTKLEELHNYWFEKSTNQKLEIERLNNIIKRLEEFIEKETEIYTLELTEKNTNALSYSLPIKAVYKEIYNVLQELKGSDKENV